MGRVRTIAMCAGVAACAAAAPASAETLRAAEAVPRACDERLHREGAAGIERSRWTAPAEGLLTARLEGRAAPASDWDLALFRSGAGRASSASSSFGSLEQATISVAAGEEIVIQACRRGSEQPSLPLALDLFETTGAPVDSPRVSLVSVPIAAPAEVAELEELGFDVTHDVSAAAATVALYGEADRARLADAGFGATTLIADLAAADRADRAAEARAATARGASGLPSGRETYRVYDDYTSEMKALAEQNPSLVRKVVIGTTFEGRTIEGIEIAAGVNRTHDGRPVYLNMGVHHAREWPSGELPMEFALDLVDGYRSDPQVTSLLRRVRVFVFPVINVDGFIASRSHGTSPADDDADATLGLSVNDSGAYKRKNCRPTVPGSELQPCAQRQSSGVDLNRNYGAYWGGSGSSSDVTAQGYRGTAPYSEPEAQAVHQFTSRLHPTVFITNHTFTDDGKWLRQPGFDDVIEVTPDEEAMKELGDAMAAATGWTSELGYETLGDITGATEDWNYFAQGTYGYTPEIRGLNFHANYADSVVEEYVGDSAHAGLGVREAYLIAGERAANEADHGVIFGRAPAGATLELRKEFDTPTSQPGLVVHDVLDTELQVRPSGRYRWHVNPSSRPLVPGESWTMSCRNGADTGTTAVEVDRGERVRQVFRASCRPR